MLRRLADWLDRWFMPRHTYWYARGEGGITIISPHLSDVMCILEPRMKGKPPGSFVPVRVLHMTRRQYRAVDLPTFMPTEEYL